MSSVTNIILCVDIDEDIEVIQHFLHVTHRIQLRRVDDYAGGDKAMECDVYMAAVNYLDTDGLEAAFRTSPFRDRANLMLRDQDDDLFRAISPTP